ncbi:MAG: YbhB/YbcL family Raf kinase inhibitor-like protein [Ilumatobacteraceae bacterium]
MRRAVLMSSAFALVVVLAACQHDGRTLETPSTSCMSSPANPTEVCVPDNNLSISTTAASTVPPVFDTIDTESQGTVITVPQTLPGDGVLTVTAPWRDGAPIDERYTCDGLNVSPPLAWSSAPEGTVEIAVTLTDLQATGYVHWVMAGVDPTTVGIAEGQIPLGAVEATNGAGALGYTGPCPPAGTTHTYRVTVHYLGQRSGLEDGEAGADMTTRIQAISVATAESSGTFSRP